VAILLATLFLSHPIEVSKAEDAQSGGNNPKPAATGTLATRLENIEQQITELKIAVGTLQSLLQSKPGVVLSQEAQQSPAPVPQTAAGELGLASRVEAMETQIAALTSQLGQMVERLKALETKPQVAAKDLEAKPQAAEEPEAKEAAAEKDAAAAEAEAILRPSQQDDTEEQPTRLVPETEDEKSGEAPANDSDETSSTESSQQAPEAHQPQPQAVAAAIPTGDAMTLYNKGYGELLRQNYTDAEAAFRRLVEVYPSDKLAGDAQYWLGESLYVRGQYKGAAEAFLKSYRDYGKGAKAPDSLLKLAMSLAALGEKDAACSSFAEFGSKFPQASGHLREMAKAEKDKSGC
jgi:tol-pal system protein YbgF